jgi:hypothetical protein
MSNFILNERALHLPASVMASEITVIVRNSRGILADIVGFVAI